ncbi:MAG: (d)CMP kinase [Eubacteriales bacterium]|nr:(d)CMP kinase [Eubacteriales bacterium]
MINVAIDGPSGAGKSTISKMVAEKLGITYLDTGAMYRAVALYAYRKGIDVNDQERVVPLLDDVDISFELKDGQKIILLNGEDVSQAIREHYVSKLASDVSKIPQVRKFLVAMQRKIAETTDVVLDGRDITSYVLPNAKFKFYLTATAEERATRRYKELTAKGQEVDFDRILNDIIDRDYNDMNRDFAPLVQTQDSLYIDSTHLSIDEVAAIIIGTVTGATKA